MRILNKLSFFNGNFKYVSILLVFYSINNLIVFGLEDKSNSFKENQKDYDFEKVHLQNSIPFEKYDSASNQLKLFFGYSSEEPEKSFFPDVSIINTSESVRELYKLKLNEMTRIK